MVVITSDQRDVILGAVEAMYTAVATRPEESYHFPTGRRACEYVGYPAEHLDRLPDSALESFAGVGYPFAAEVIGMSVFGRSSPTHSRGSPVSSAA